MEKPLVSIVITCYNYAEYVKEAIESVLNQSYSNIELVVINDGSTDDSHSVISQLKSGNDFKYITRDNRGIVATRNEALGIAEGDYLLFLDADDYFDKTFVEEMIVVALDRDADVVYPNWRVFGDEEYQTDFDYFTLDALVKHKIHCTSESLIRMNSIKGHRFESLEVAEDWDFFLGLALSGKKFALSKESFINYRVRSNTRSKSRPYWKDMYIFCEILKKWDNLYPGKLNPFDLPISVIRERDEFIGEQSEIISHRLNELNNLRELVRNSEDIIKDLKKREILLKNSLTYRIGSAVIFPAKFVRNILSRFK